MQLSILIINYNAKYFAEHCLLSVKKACEGIAAEILFWDNHSSDGSCTYLETKFPGVQFFWNGENIGFGKANNELLKYAKGDHILFLNPDTIVPEDCFSRCIGFFKKQRDAGALGVRMIDGSGVFLPESKRGFPNASASFYKITGLGKLFPRSKIFAAYHAGHLPEKETNRVDVLAGAFMMISKAVLEKVEGFDEAFFMYGEDIDLSYRIKQAGFANYYFPETTIIHFKGESTNKSSPSYNKHFYGAMKLFADKHYSGFRRFMIRKGIGMSRWIGGISKSSAGHKKPEIPADILLIANEDADTEKVTGILAANRIQRNNESGNICFCEGALSNKLIIEQLQQGKSGTDFFIHERDADSIIGSSDKNSNGIVITDR